MNDDDNKIIIIIIIQFNSIIVYLHANLTAQNAITKPAGVSRIIIIIQFNSVHVYLRANLTAQMPITKLARERRRDNKHKTYRKCKIR
jgi:hypothetical protein